MNEEDMDILREEVDLLKAGLNRAQANRCQCSEKRPDIPQGMSIPSL
jgi:hypothetical protein